MTIKRERKFKGSLARKLRTKGSGIDFDDEIEFTEPIQTTSVTKNTRAPAVNLSTTAVSSAFQPNVNLIKPQYRKIGN
jgi:hypothetical protein